MRAVLLFLILFGISAGLIFGYKFIRKQDIKVGGKLIFAAILSLIFSTIIYLGEVA